MAVTIGNRQELLGSRNWQDDVCPEFRRMGKWRMTEEKMLDRAHFRFEGRLVLVGRLVKTLGLWRTCSEVADELIGERVCGIIAMSYAF
jgi:hypothetical protein